MPPPGSSGMAMAVTTKATRKALALRLGILGDEEIVRMSVTEGGIQSEQMIDKQRRPVMLGVHDPRMGTTDRDSRCGTCGCDAIECPGHFGHIELAKPIYHPGYIDNVLKVLRCVCSHCGRLRLTESERLELRKIARAPVRFRKVMDACKNKKVCEIVKDTNLGCGRPQPRYTKNGLNITVNNAGGVVSAGQQATDTLTSFRAIDARKILEMISDEDMRLMGMNPKESRPEWMIIKVLPVGPPPIRPSVTAGDAMRSEDDLTGVYHNIVIQNNLLKHYINSGQPEASQDEVLMNLQLRVATLMNNNIADQPQQKHSGGRPIKDIRSRLKGKEGRVRGNLMGKRVDFSARTVITPDPILQLDQLGVPEAIAKNLTVPERVTRENLQQMKQLVSNGPTRWPGAKYIIRHDEKQIDLANKKNLADADLDIGYTVERHLRDDDYVVFNRQPSLHKMSLMGHRVKVLPFMTFRLNLSVTSPYNADFDGDEMNMHVPQSYETKAEVKEIMAVPKQVIAPKDNKPVMGIVQDALLGIMLFTQRDRFIELDQVMNLLMWLDIDGKLEGKLPTPAILKPRPLWTGKQLLSLVIPPVNFKVKSGKDNWDCPNDKNLLVKNGELLCGVVIKKIVGAAPGGLVHIVWKDLGPEACKIFMSDLQNLINNWLVGNGFTVGVQDIIAPPTTVATIQKALGKYKRKVQRISQKAQRGQLKQLPGKGIFESFEVNVNEALAAALETSGRIAHEDLEPTNRLKNMVSSGSKGGNINISQIMACVGQQNVNGQRIPFGFNRRSLPHFSKDDFGPDSKGFVSNCYVHGLTPQEFYFHAMGGREGLIDTAVKTADTGYIQRRLIKALEDVQVKYDGTVRTSRDQVIQFIYGEDGLDATHIENLSIPLLKMDNQQLQKKFQLLNENSEQSEKRVKLKESINDELIDNHPDFDSLCKIVKGEFDQLYEDREELRHKIIKTVDDAIHMPINMDRLLWTSRERFGIRIRDKTDLTPDYVISKTKDLLNQGINVYQEPRLQSSDLFRKVNIDATRLIKIYLRYHLASKNIIENQRLTRESFDWLLAEIQSRFERALVHPGEMVGSIGAQSMGEPATQMTLNTFHLAGVGTKNVTLGVPRLKEVINVASTIKTPSLQIFLEDQYGKDEGIARSVGNYIEHTTLSQLASSSSIYYDPDPRNTIISADEALLNFHNTYFAQDDEDQSEVSPWIFRFELDSDKMLGRALEIEDIERILTDAFPDLNLGIVRHGKLDNVQKLVMRVRFPDPGEAAEDGKGAPMLLKEIEGFMLNDLTLKGFPEITKFTFNKLRQASESIFDPVTGKQEDKNGQFIIETDGLGLKKVLGVDKVDYTRTTSNSVREILTVLGVEAARQSLIHELRFVLGSYSIYVNYRHLSTLCDIMTNRGVLTSITRHGINRVDSGALRKCSFEETVEILLEASFHAEIDPLSGVTENIIMGQLAPYGTGSFDLMADTDMMKEANDLSGDIAAVQDINGGMQDIFDVNDMDGGTPVWMTPTGPGAQGGTSYHMPGSAYGAFSTYQPGSPMAASPVSSPQYDQYKAMACPSSPIYGGGATPGPTPDMVNPGGHAGYSPTSPAYGRGPGTTPGYGGGGQTPGYNYYGGTAGGGYPAAGTSPAYAPYSPARFGGGPAGGTTPGYAGAMGGMSMGYRPNTGQSPGYTAGGPAYSPTQNFHGTPDPAYTGRPQGNNNQQPGGSQPPEKK